MKRLLFCMLAVLAANRVAAVRSSAPLKDIRYDHSQIFSLNVATALLVGAGSNKNTNGALSVALLTPSFGPNGEKISMFTPLAHDASLQGISVQDMVISSSQPVIAVKDDTKKNSVYMITDPLGNSVLASPVLKDAAGTDVTNGVVALAGSSSYVFALVGSAGKTFDALDANDRGVAVLQKKVGGTTPPATDSSTDTATSSQSSLAQLNASDFTSTDGIVASRLDVSTTPQLFSFVDPSATNPIAKAWVGTNASMVWDEKLQRLYVGLSDVSRDDANKEGGCLALTMGLIDVQANGGTSPALRFVPVVKNIGKDLFYKKTGDAANYAAAVQLAYELVALAQQTEDRKVPAQRIKDMFADSSKGLFKNYIDRVNQGKAPIPVPINDVITAATGKTDLAVIKNDLQPLIKTNRTAAADAVKAECVNGLDSIFGFYYDGTSLQQTEYNVMQARHDGNDDVSVSVNKLCVMHTSTGRSYLILESVIANNPVNNRGLVLEEAEDWIYALPLIDSAPDNDQEILGTIPKVDKNGVPEMIDSKGAIVIDGGKFQVPKNFEDMPKAMHQAVRVAQSNPVPGSWIDQLFVVGDSVYMGLIGPNTSQRGMYKSTAIFGNNGFIIGWTAAERVMGFVADVFAGGMDVQTGNFYSVTDGGTVGRVTEWGKGDPSLHGGSIDTTLSAVLESNFPQAEGGVHQLVPFNKHTFSGKIAITVAIGRDKIALIQTGKQGSQGFIPTAGYKIGDTMKIMSFPQIAPLTSATFFNESGNDILVVSGFKGMMKYKFNGRIDSVTKPQQSSTLLSSNPILKVMARPNGFYALGLKNLFKYDGYLRSVAQSTNGVDMVVINDTVIYAAGSSILTTPGGALVSVPGRILHMSYLAAAKDGLPDFPGNLYVLVEGPQLQLDEKGNLVASTKKTATQVYRYGLFNDTSVKMVPLDKDTSGKVVPYVQFNDPRSLVTADGSLLFNALPKDTGIADFVRLLPITPRQSLDTMLAGEYQLYNDLEINDLQNFNVSTISRDPSSGAWMIPGDWGVRVNE